MEGHRGLGWGGPYIDAGQISTQHSAPMHTYTPHFMASAAPMHHPPPMIPPPSGDSAPFHTASELRTFASHAHVQLGKTNESNGLGGVPNNSQPQVFRLHAPSQEHRPFMVGNTIRNDTFPTSHPQSYLSTSQTRSETPVGGQWALSNGTSSTADAVGIGRVSGAEERGVSVHSQVLQRIEQSNRTMAESQKVLSAARTFAASPASSRRFPTLNGNYSRDSRGWQSQPNDDMRLNVGTNDSGLVPPDQPHASNPREYESMVDINQSGYRLGHVDDSVDVYRRHHPETSTLGDVNFPAGPNRNRSWQEHPLSQGVYGRWRESELESSIADAYLPRSRAPDPPFSHTAASGARYHSPSPPSQLVGQVGSPRSTLSRVAFPQPTDTTARLYSPAPAAVTDAINKMAEETSLQQFMESASKPSHRPPPPPPPGASSHYDIGKPITFSVANNGQENAPFELNTAWDALYEIELREKLKDASVTSPSKNGQPSVHSPFREAMLALNIIKPGSDADGTRDNADNEQAPVAKVKPRPSNDVESWPPVYFPPTSESGSDETKTSTHPPQVSKTTTTTTTTTATSQPMNNLRSNSPPRLNRDAGTQWESPRLAFPDKASLSPSSPQPSSPLSEDKLEVLRHRPRKRENLTKSFLVANTTALDNKANGAPIKRDTSKKENVRFGSELERIAFEKSFSSARLDDTLNSLDSSGAELLPSHRQGTTVTNESTNIHSTHLSPAGHDSSSSNVVKRAAPEPPSQLDLEWMAFKESFAKQQTSAFSFLPPQPLTGVELNDTARHTPAPVNFQLSQHQQEAESTPMHVNDLNDSQVTPQSWQPPNMHHFSTPYANLQPGLQHPQHYQQHAQQQQLMQANPPAQSVQTPHQQVMPHPNHAPHPAVLQSGGGQSGAKYLSMVNSLTGKESYLEPTERQTLASMSREDKRRLVELAAQRVKTSLDTTYAASLLDIYSTKREQQGG